jgi:hypothetical protein
MLAGAASHAAEIEPQHHASRSPQSARNAMHHLIQHGPPAQRVWMANQAGFDGRAVVARAVAGFFQQRFEPAGGAFDEMRFDSPGH